MQDELIKSYMQVLNEEVDSSAVKGSTQKPGNDAFGDFKEGNDADENVDLEKPESDKELSSNVKEGEPKKLKKESKAFQNPFDALYSKVLGENSFDFSTEEDNEIEPSDDEHEFPEDDGQNEPEFSDLEDGEDDLESGLDELEGEEEDEEIDLQELVGTLKDVLGKLEKIVDVEGEEEEDIEDLEDIETDEDEEDEEGFEDAEEKLEDEEETDEEVEKPLLNKESKEWKKKKLALKKKKNEKKAVTEGVKVKGLKAGLSSFKGNIKKLQAKKAEVPSKIKATKGKAQTPSNKGYDGALNKLAPAAGLNLTKASSHTVSGAVKPGKALFEQ